MVTGKAVELGGSKGRASVTERGVYISTKLILQENGLDIKGTKIAIQEMGNVGGNAARIFYHRHAVIVVLSDVSAGIYCEDGLDADDVSDFINIYHCIKKAYTRRKNQRSISLNKKSGNKLEVYIHEKRLPPLTCSLVLQWGSR